MDNMSSGGFIPFDDMEDKIFQLERRIEMLENRAEMTLNILSGMDIPDIESKIEEIENDYRRAKR